ncbi:Omega-6 fatty acid desaturase, endoplasmic reticulum [Tolypocladium ophioglossoides CBS 100239]|uniref:Omega-6 fatty acid desaturase, endoplasmic reticulum n=1 Tax=Tolypocladium ophioglossoides (strain CBS 100239) TaxID=1163406 RepID=A0A0L0N1U3_TOLOC|nr:Omega-6 fatty acid desaturase, endoplasmic reticulum [Tolypocladium ophioglossoides CBS 100239]
MATATVDDCHYVPETHHLEVVPSGYVDGIVGIGHLRKAIPSHCFKPSIMRSISFFLRDILFMTAPLAATLYLERRIDSPLAKLVLCAAVYPFVVGIPATGFWVLGHEAGHGAFSQSRVINDLFGFICHSFLLSPFFSWRSTHSRHHVYANHLSKDHNYVPHQKHEYVELFKGKLDFHEVTEDAPATILLRVILQQVVGWPWYLLTSITAAPGAVVRPSKGCWNNSHLDPWGSLFRPDEFWSIVASDLGLIAMGYILYHFSPESWTFLRGALSTVDRDPGFLLRHLMHHIVDLHVVHHLFPRIPHYHAQEATDAIRPLLGKYYRQESGSWYGALYRNFRDCQWVEPDPMAKEMRRVPKSDEAGIYWYRPGNMPHPALTMRS